MTRSPIFEAAAALWKEAQAAYLQLMDVELEAAEVVCSGHLLSPAAYADGYDAWRVWMGTPAIQELYASPELLDYLRDHPRTDRIDHERAYLAREGL